jgi:hypothetical protein
VLQASGPIVTLNSVGEVRGIRWNDRSILPPAVPRHDVDEVYGHCECSPVSSSGRNWRST